MTYSTIHTTYGLGRIAASEATGLVINLTHMAVGDGAGSAVTPSPGQTALVNERYRTTINTVHQDPSNPLLLYVEMLIPAAIGGWWIREFGIFDDQGQLFAVGNFPDAYKTLPSDGATDDLAVRAQVIVSAASVITLTIDPAVTVATRQWVTQNITAAALIPGGTTGQVLTKDSNLDGAASWHTPGSQTVLVNTLEERQSVTANPQLTFNLTTLTTFGLAVYVEGARIPKKAGSGGWQQGASTTQVVLGDQYPIGTEITFCQNDPVSSLPNVLDANQNLADVQNVATARTNLGVYSKAESDQLSPTGIIGYFPRATAPAGWLKANGAAVSRTTYAALFAVIGTMFGSGDGSTTFNLPDLRGEFVRGVDDGRGVDAGRTVGSAQSAYAGNLTFSIIPDDGDGQTGSIGALTTLTINGVQVNATVGPLSATAPVNPGDTRPRNVAFLACIKY